MNVIRRAAVAGAFAAALVSVAGPAAAPASAATGGTSVAVPGRYTMDVGSNIRGDHKLNSHIYGVAGRGAYIDVECWARGDDVNTGRHHTNVWYTGGVWTGSRYLDDVWVWGGNVDTPHDPPGGMAHC